MQVFKEGTTRKRIGILKELPFCITVQSGLPGTFHCYSGDEYHVGCLGCANPRCMQLDESEIDCDAISGFPSDKTAAACPVDAMSWDKDNDIPQIDTNKCITCGICVSRCPVGALYYDNQVRVNIGETPVTEFRTPNEENRDLQIRQMTQLVDKPRAGVIINASDELFENIYSKLDVIRSEYHNPIGRNLLIALGCKCSMRRIGDVYTRMDAIYSSPAGSFGAVEIEFGRDTLDASRGILDDIAVLNTRYGVNKSNNKALVICLHLPNARQGYWQVVKDVSNVEHIKIGTVTIGALMLLLWNGCKLEPERNLYYIDYDNMNLRQAICYQLDCEDIDVSTKELGIFEPNK